MKIVIHTGIPKTGTSALQAFLKRNSAGLAERGVWYETPDGHTNHNAVAYRFSTPGFETAAPIVLQRIVGRAHQNNCPVVLLSAEDFSKPIKMDLLRECVGEIEVEIITYMRPPDDVAISAYNQLVRAYSTRWTTRVGERMSFDPNYRSVLWQWAQSGWPLRLAPYDPKQWPDQSLFRDFLQMVGVDPAGFDFSQHKDGNHSLSPMFLAILNRLNRLHLSEGGHTAIVKALYRVQDITGPIGRVAMPEDKRREMRSVLADNLHLYRQYFRSGFDERFLTE